LRCLAMRAKIARGYLDIQSLVRAGSREVLFTKALSK
jgi:hypothetical protein